MKLVITNATLDARPTSIAVDGHMITAIGDHVPTNTADAVVDAAGAAVVPGLHDHHLHLFAMAAALGSVQCGPSAVHSIDDLARALRDAPGDGEIRGVGYHESVAGPLDRDVLDRLVCDRPVRVQHRSGGLWVLNSKAIAERHLDASDGRVFRGDEVVRSVDADLPDLAEVGQQLLSYGVTGVTDATPDLEFAAMQHLAAAVASGVLPQSVTALGAPDDWTDPEVAQGPRKLLLHDHDLPTYDELAERVHEARTATRAVAVHCVTRESLMLTLAVLEDVGAVTGDRIEHGAVVPRDVYRTMRSLGVAVVTQPCFIRERGDDYLTDVDPHDLECLYPYRSLLDAGVPVAASSDAPYGDVDPWSAIAAAGQRRTPSGATIGRSEAVDAATALAGYLSPAADPGGPPRRLRVGPHSGLCVLTPPPVRAAVVVSRSGQLVSPRG